MADTRATFFAKIRLLNNSFESKDPCFHLDLEDMCKLKGLLSVFKNINLAVSTNRTYLVHETEHFFIRQLEELSTDLRRFVSALDSLKVTLATCKLRETKPETR
jgi:hypothetical protein